MEAQNNRLSKGSRSSKVRRRTQLENSKKLKMLWKDTNSMSEHYRINLRRTVKESSKSLKSRKTNVMKKHQLKKSLIRTSLLKETGTEIQGIQRVPLKIWPNSENWRHSIHKITKSKNRNWKKQDKKELTYI